MPYRSPDDPNEKLPDIVGASRRRAALRLGAIGAGSIVFGAIMLSTSVLRMAKVTGCLAVGVGLILICLAVVFAVRRER